MVSGLSSRLSSLASSGPLYLVFTGATPRRGYPGGVLRQHGTAGPPGLPHGRGVRRPWLETAPVSSHPPGQPASASDRRTTIRLEGLEFPTPVIFAEEGEPSLLGVVTLEEAALAVDPAFSARWRRSRSYS